ncbi:MAG: hypothetical protein RL238_3673 [Actinomycetota bacterium]
MQLAQFNIARLHHPIDHPASAGFIELIDETNARAEASPGFVWRHGIDTRDADDAPYDDKLITVNASVWASIDDLRHFAYRGWHRDVFRRRQEWFQDSAAVMWWVHDGTIPTMHDCLVRLAFHDEFGSTPYAFGMGERVPVLLIQHHEHGDTRRVTATLDGASVGVCEWSLDDDGARVQRLASDGNDAELLAAVETVAFDAGAGAITVAADCDHDVARRLGYDLDGSTISKALGPIRRRGGLGSRPSA